MKNYQKKQLISKLKVISNLGQQHHFSQKVFRQLRCKKSLNNSSFNKGDIVSSRESKKNISSAQVTPKYYPERDYQQLSAYNSRVQQRKDENKKKQETLKYKKITQFKQMTDGGQQISSPNIITYRNQMSHRRYLLENKTTKSPGNTLQTMLQNSCKIFDQTKRKCRQCKNTIEQKNKILELLALEINNLKVKLRESQQRFENLKKTIEPYISNVNLMSVIVDSLADKKQLNDRQNESIRLNQNQENSEQNQEAKVNMWLLKQSKIKDKKMYIQTYKFQCQIDKLSKENIMLKQEVSMKDILLKNADQRVKNAEFNNSIRQRLQMCREQLYWFKLQYQQKNGQIRDYNIKIQQLKHKLNVLTSLIGCAIIFDIQAKEKDKIHLNQVLNRIDKFENLVSSKMENINSLEYLKIMNYSDNQLDNVQLNQNYIGRKEQIRHSKIFHNNQIHSKRKNQRLYLPNYLIFLGQESITSKVQHVVIKPQLFIKIRSILDSKYIDYRLFGISTSKFPQFCNSYLRNYDIQSNEKKPYLVSRHISEIENKESNLLFLKHLMDERIQDLPQVQIFRDCFLGKYQEDEIYFYLMCRHKLIEGSQLQNFINSGDPSKLIKFDKTKRTVIKITQKFGRTIQNFICHHINQRKITRGRQQFLRLYYVLKFLFLIYRKIRTKKIQQFRVHFNNSIICSKKNTSFFLHFNQLIRKNFDFLTRSQICGMFRKTYALYISHKEQVQFYQCFVASSLPTIFLQQLMKFDQKLQFDCQDEEMLINFKNYSMTQKQKRPSKQLKMKKQTTDREQNSSQMTSGQPRLSYLTDQMNQINELWPDTVYKLGNQRLNKTYYELTNANPQKIRSKLQLLKFLLDVGHGHLIKQNTHIKVKTDFSLVLNESIINLIEVLNKIQKHKIDYENEVNLASKKLGKFFKNKIYQFYNEMLQDINKIRKKQSKANEKKKESETLNSNKKG